MKFLRIGPVGEERPTLLQDGLYFDLTQLTDDICGEFFESNGISRVREALNAGELLKLSYTTNQRIGAPIARPSAVFCVGMNYAAHAAESGSMPPESPIIFLKPPNTVVGPTDTITIPRNSVKTDWEVELGIVVGTRASYLDSPTESIHCIAGFVAANDLSERRFQLEISGGQWSIGKSAPGFCPTGPWLVTPDEVDCRSMRLRSWVNGQPRQDSSTADLVFDVDFLVWYLSQYATLEPGDLILSGTPAGVALSGRFPYLNSGDVCEIEVEGLGKQRQSFVGYGEAL